VVGATGRCGNFNTNSGLYLVEKHAVLWEGGVPTDLGNLGGSGEFAGHHACAINYRGEVVGHSDLTGDQTFHTFLWTKQTGMRDLGTIDGDVASTAIGLNDRGVVVGTSLDSHFNPRAFVWQNGVMSDLNAAVSSNPGRLYLLLGYSINAGGEIVGLAATADGNLHAFLAVPSAVNAFPTASDTVTRPTLSPEDQRLIFQTIRIRRN
jgi:probable HAF family extracellular repeat protein